MGSAGWPLANAPVAAVRRKLHQDTTIKKIVGHSGAMSLTEKVYTHLDVQILVDAINKTLEE